MEKRQDTIRSAFRLFAISGLEGTIPLLITQNSNIIELLLYCHPKGKDKLFPHISPQKIFNTRKSSKSNLIKCLKTEEGQKNS